MKTYLIDEFCKNLKPGISVYRICRWTPGYRIFTNTILQGEIAFDADITLNHVIKLCMAAAYLNHVLDNFDQLVSHASRITEESKDKVSIIDRRFKSFENLVKVTK